ncbi:hypothetical protein H1S01_19385 [Heliobacterium chlorum]|uniref:Copper amine oxidase-like N-terminal domain-containing protein n=1 Tax=Heliobacterium chlorum TaxID=2698 RepID=A0ABR7T9N1_HELCL|nr:hypothetical protein [Heliobacterium chlorum]MBC9786611.1 hypothetical protein [Heliobacterium chlorum]
MKNEYKGPLILIISFWMAIFFSAIAYGSSNDANIIIYGKETGVKTTFIDDRIWVPFIDIFAFDGYSVAWDGKSSKLVAKKVLSDGERKKYNTDTFEDYYIFILGRSDYDQIWTDTNGGINTGGGINIEPVRVINGEPMINLMTYLGIVHDGGGVHWDPFSRTVTVYNPH